MSFSEPESPTISLTEVAREVPLPDSPKDAQDRLHFDSSASGKSYQHDNVSVRSASDAHHSVKSASPEMGFPDLPDEEEISVKYFEDGMDEAERKKTGVSSSIPTSEDLYFRRNSDDGHKKSAQKEHIEEYSEDENLSFIDPGIESPEKAVPAKKNTVLKHKVSFGKPGPTYFKSQYHQIPGSSKEGNLPIHGSKKSYKFGKTVNKELLEIPKKIFEENVGGRIKRVARAFAFRQRQEDGEVPEDAEFPEHYESSEVLQPMVYDPNIPGSFSRDAGKDFQKSEIASEGLSAIVEHFNTRENQECAYCPASNDHETEACSELFPPLGIRPHKKFHRIVFSAEHLLIEAYMAKIQALRKLICNIFQIKPTKPDYDPDGCDYCGKSSHSLFMCLSLFPYLNFKLRTLETTTWCQESEMIQRYASHMKAFRLDASELVVTMNECIEKVGKEHNLHQSYHDIISGSKGVISVAHLKAALHGFSQEKTNQILCDFDKKYVTRAMRHALVISPTGLLDQDLTPATNAVTKRARLQIIQDEKDLIANELDKLSNQKRVIIGIEGEEGYQFRQCVLALRTQQLKNKIDAENSYDASESAIQYASERRAVENSLLRAKVLELSAKVESLNTVVHETKVSLAEAADALPTEKRKQIETKSEASTVSKKHGVEWFWWR